MSDEPGSSISIAGIVRGASDLASTMPTVFVFGVGFGAAAVTFGVSPELAVTMSSLIFAGASQYAALDLWQYPLPILALLILTVAINARHLVLGATLQPWLTGVSPPARYGVIALLSDANWAATQQAIGRGEDDVGYLLGGGLALWLAWVAGTAAGAYASEAVPDLKQLGLDLLLPAFFACALMGFAERRSDWRPWLIGAGCAAAASQLVAVHWSVLLGTAAGGISGWFADDSN
ncbi:MAG TPA: AzlC family ABC transporter permease [Nitrospiraceae bacterium]|nr:AzlC family ABC transporter permease [Nitrospiraceae bacterium]